MNNEKLIDELVRDEGLRLKPYQDSRGVLTIGIGRNLRDVGISREEAYHLVNNDVEGVVGDLDRSLPWWNTLNEVRQRAIVNMAFNLGVPGLLAFRKTLSLLEAGDFEGAATEMLCSDWAKQVGPRAQRLSNAIRDGV